MKSFLEKLHEDAATHLPVVMAFGRMNPPTIGHEKLVNHVRQIANDYHAPHHIIISHSVDAKKNPLEAKAKLKHARRFFPGANIETSTKEAPTFLQHAARLHAAGHDHLIMVAGSDRVDEYQKKLEQYNGEGPGKLFNFKKIEVKSAGHRDPDAEGTEGMSASKMREHAKNNDFNSFKQGVPTHVPEKHAKELFRDVRRGMGLNESVNRGLFKAIFVTGGPGSGKDVIIREAIAEGKSVEFNSVQAFDLLMDKVKLSESDDYRCRAIRNRYPLIINGPADAHLQFITIKEELEELGYSTSMIFVNTTDETSRERNAKLTKAIIESVRQEKWSQAQACKESYKQNFKQFIEFNNSGSLEEIEEDITDTYNKINSFIDSNTYTESAIDWLESHNKNGVNDIIKLYKENENVKKTSRFFENYKNKSKPVLRTGTGPVADNPGSVQADNRASEPNADNIKWNGNKKTGGYVFKTYTEGQETPHIQIHPEPKETNFSKDKDKVKNKKRFSDAPTVSQRLRNTSGIGSEFDTRQQGTVYPMSGLGDVTYRESYNDPADSEMGVAGTLGGSTNKEPMENPKDKIGFRQYIKKKNGVKK